MTSSRRLKVAVFSDAYDDYTLCLVNALAERSKVVLVQPNHNKRFDAAELDSGVELHRVDKPRIRDPRGLGVGWTIRRLLTRSEPDIIHVQQSGDPTINPWLINMNRRVPVVMTVHDVRPHPGDASYRRGANSTQRGMARSVDGFIAHGHGLRADLVSAWGVDPERAHVIPHGELGTLYRNRTSTESSLRREPGRILFFGRRWGYKGFEVLVKAVGSSSLSDQQITLVVAGSGEPIGDLSSQLPSNVELEVIDRYLNSDEVVGQFDRASIVCLPYIEASQSGVAALALGLRTPIVASAVGGLSELLGPEVAVMTPPGDSDELADAIRSVLTDSADAEKRASAGLRRASTELSWSSVADRHVRLFSSLLG